MTRRTADVLHACLQYLAAGLRSDIEERGGEPVTDPEDWKVMGCLPRITWTTTTAWRRRLALAADDLICDLEEGRWPIAHCAGEAAVLWLAITYSPHLTDTIAAFGDHQALPDQEGDYDWQKCEELILASDHDDRQCFDYRDLPAWWFVPFSGAEPRDLRREPQS
ncbi:hypothetical protein [Longispora albida]|uniref:hypothetical protein n=1 Tax=Longispora albida TaxID=203523 RepID=UPI0012FBEC40|nr:hypothetical protein [Longispora albida]